MAPVIKKPKHPVPFPPASHLRAYQVRDGDNWWTLQKQFGLRDPWSLIQYNFGTHDPAEVNWYLREYVGCTLMTADQKNYRFSRAAKPGLLYLPRHNYKHGLGGGGGSGSGSSGGGKCYEPDPKLPKDAVAESTVLWALGLPSVHSIQFNICGYQVTPADYDRVRRLIQAGEIVVAHNPSLDGDAAYAPETDTIYLKHSDNREANAVALIIHEATHAAFDAREVKLYDVTSEAIAYVAQMMFTLARFPATKPPLYDGDKEQKIFAPAYRYAKRLLAKLQNWKVPPVFSTTAEQDLIEIMKGLIAHPIYIDQFSCADTYYDSKAGYNGVKGWVYSWVAA
jgi:hypothetical protein